jgi:hypothetical protein
MEYAREDVEQDEHLHYIAQNAVKLSKMKDVLSMEDYDKLTTLYVTFESYQLIREDAIEDTHKHNRELAKKALEKRFDPTGKGFLIKYLSISDPIEANKFWVDRNISKLVNE